jgi:hypothetical protein
LSAVVAMSASVVALAAAIAMAWTSL